MRARPREINIFNMSLLDILCGALGAFCFMMLVALPYYVAGTDADARNKKTEALLQDVQKLRERMSDPAQAEELRHMSDGLEAQIKQLQGELNQSGYEIQQLKNEVQQLTRQNGDLEKQNDELVRQTDELKKQNDEYATKDQKQRRVIAQRKPTAVLVTANNESQQVDLYLEDDLVQEGGTKSVNPPFDPAKPWHSSNWANDITGITDPERGFRVWITSQTVAGGNYRLFIKEGGEPNRRHATAFSVIVYGDFPQARFGQVAEMVLGPARFWDLVGTLSVDVNWHLSFKEASQAERNEEWRKRKLEPPPVPAEEPIATPTPKPTPIDYDALDRARKSAQELIRKRLEEEQRRQQQQQSPSPGSRQPTPNERRELTEEEIRVLREESLRRQQSPAPQSPGAPPAAERGSDLAERALRRRREREAHSPAPSVAESPAPP